MKPRTLKYKAYNDKYYLDNKEQIKERKKKYYDENKDRVKPKSRISSSFTYKKYKDKFFNMYGTRCECCGESEPMFLSLEHKLGQRGKRRDTTYKAYKNAIKEFQPSIYGVLCHNCNQATRHGFPCPHTIKGSETIE